MENLKVKKAKANEVDTIETILYETAVWLKGKGSTQWAGLLNGKDVHNIEEAVKREEVFLVYDSGQLIGTLALWDKQSTWDKELWGEDSTTDYFYLHRIALTNEARGKSMGRKLISGAKSIANEVNKKEIRLDCIASNAYLNSFYQKNGFTFKKTVEDYYNGEEYEDFNLYTWKNTY